MREPIELHGLDARIWSLWLVAIFGPLVLLGLLGVVLVPVWTWMICVQLAGPERFAHDAVSISAAALPMAYVAAGFMVYLGLPLTAAAWLLARAWRSRRKGLVLPDRERPRQRSKREHRDDWRLDA